MTGGLSLYVLWPRELRFAIDARATYEDLYPLLDDPAEAQLRVAYGARDRYTRNKTSIDQLELAFRECPRNCVGMNERDAHAFNRKQEISRSSEFL